MAATAMTFYMLFTVINVVWVVITGTVYTVIKRVKTKTFSMPEDYKANGLDSPAPFSNVERAASLHRNHIENVPLFLIVMFAHTTSPEENAKDVVLAYMAIFTFFRILHSIMFIVEASLPRTLTFVLSLFTMLAATLHLLALLKF